MNFKRYSLVLMVFMMGISLAACSGGASTTPEQLNLTVEVVETAEPATPEPQETPETTVYPAPVEIAGATAYPYPGPVVPTEDPALANVYPGPAFITPISPADSFSGNFSEGPLNLPTPGADLGVVTGKFEVKNPTMNVFLAGDIYLAPVIYTEGEIQVPFVSLDVLEDPAATLRNRDLEFGFVDVRPGEYGIILHTPVNDYIIPDGLGGYLLIEVKAGELLDLGTIILE